MSEIILNLGHIARTEGQGGRRICPNEDIEFFFGTMAYLQCCEELNENLTKDVWRRKKKVVPLREIQRRWQYG